MIFQDESNDEKRDSKENSHTGNKVNEMFNFNGNWSLVTSKTTGQVSDTSHNGVITSLNSDTHAVPFQSICWEESQVPCLQGILICTVGSSALWLRFTSEGRVVYLQCKITICKLLTEIGQLSHLMVKTLLSEKGCSDSISFTYSIKVIAYERSNENPY